MSVMVVGDIHASWGPLNKLINQKKPSIILQVGDFGWWPTMKEFGWDPRGVKTNGTKLYFCDGNHEDHWALQKAVNAEDWGPVELYEGVIYQPRGSTFILPDGRVVLFMGGAFSIDGKSRTVGFDFFPCDETISQADFNRLPDCKVDIVISHTCPTPMIPIRKLHDAQDSSEIALDRVLEIYRPALWYFGHWHIGTQGCVNGCQWYCLNMASRGVWWKWLDQ